MELAVQAARVRATLVKFLMRLKKWLDRHKAVIRSISGVYSTDFTNEEEISEVQKMTDEFLGK